MITNTFLSEIVQSRTFRRLKGKKQAFNHIYDDHCRDRMTHSLEVVAIAELITKEINNKIEKDKKQWGNKVKKDLVVAIALLHDIGHAPFGHVGERALHKLSIEYANNITEQKNRFKNAIGYKHNHQSAYILCKLAPKLLENLNKNEKEVILSGLLNHTNKVYRESHEISQVNPYYYENVLETKMKTYIEGNIVYLADEIAQLFSDYEDALDRKLVNVDCYNKYIDENNKYEKQTQVKKLVSTTEGMESGYIFNYFYDNILDDLIKNLVNRIDKTNKNDISNFRPTVLSNKFTNIKSFIEYIIKNDQTIRQENDKGKKIINDLFKAYFKNPLILKDDTLKRLLDKNNPKDLSRLKMNLQGNRLSEEILLALSRVIINHISGMTDNYAIAQWQDLQEKGLLP